MGQAIAFYTLAAFILGFAVLVVTTKDTVHSVLFLVLDFLFVAALYGTDFESTTDGAAWLDQYCARERTERFVENPKYELKRNVFGPAQGSQWRIEVRRYACNHQSNVPGP